MPLLVLPPLMTPCDDTGLLLLGYKNRTYIFWKLYVPNLTDWTIAWVCDLLLDVHNICIRMIFHDSIMLLLPSHSTFTKYMQIVKELYGKRKNTKRKFNHFNMLFKIKILWFLSTRYRSYFWSICQSAKFPPLGFCSYKLSQVLINSHRSCHQEAMWELPGVDTAPNWARFFLLKICHWDWEPRSHCVCGWDCKSVGNAYEWSRVTLGTFQ